MKIILILLLLLISHCSYSTHDYVDKEVVRVQSNVSPSIGTLAGETSVGLLLLAFDVYGYINFNLNKKEIDLHTDAIFLALNHGKNGETFSWHNKKRMSSGKIKIVASYYRNKNYCRIVQSLINLNGASKHKTFNTCLEKKNWVYY